MYEKYLNDGDIAKILDGINEMHRGEIVSCHGRGHAMRVVAATEQVLSELGYDARTVEMGKIAALLHDIGIIAGRRKHAKKSAALAKIFLSRDDFSPNEKSSIVQAIDDHSDGKKICSAIGAALVIADKIDISRNRIFDLPNLDAVHKNLLELEDVVLSVSDKIISVNYIGTPNFSPELLIRDFKKVFKLPRRAAKFLGCKWRVHFNGLGD
ncbi:MAG: HD domain-containing protein [Defluviitaleaceae bacterium]|nr:HD domain-containing protein [Defluviitaleaceae bacterium]